MDSKTLLLFGIIGLIAVLQSNLKLPQEIISFVKNDFGKLFLLALTIMVGYYYDLHVGVMMGVLVALLVIKYDRHFFVVAEGFANKKDDDVDGEIYGEMDGEKVVETSPPHDDEADTEKHKKEKTKCPEGTKHVTKEDQQVFSHVSGKAIEACVADPTMTEEIKIADEVMDMGEELVDEPDTLPDEDVGDEGFVGSRVREHFGCGCGGNSVKKIETFVNAPKDSDVPLAKNSYCIDKWGYDQAGCRYDMKSDPANDYPYGKPLAGCDTYRDNQVSVTGTVFYPLNN